MTKLIAITGPDGSGKSTVCKLLSQQLQKSLIINVWNSLESSPFYPCKSCMHCYLKTIHPIARSLLIYHGIAQSLYAALEQKLDYIFLDGYWYKYAITEQALSGSTIQFDIASLSLPKPDYVFYLDAQPETALKRKSFLSSYECGFCENNQDTEFINFQSSVQQFWQRALETNASWISITTQSRNAQATAHTIIQKLLTRPTQWGEGPYCDNNQISC